MAFDVNHRLSHLYFHSLNIVGSITYPGLLSIIFMIYYNLMKKDNLLVRYKNSFPLAGSVTGYSARVLLHCCG